MTYRQCGLTTGRPRRAADELLKRVFGREPAGIAIAPGRVNLIGEHTDYNGGFVLPMAIDRGVEVAFAARPDDVVRAHAAAYGETATLRIPELQPGRLTGWRAYIGGVAWAMRAAGLPVAGADLAIAADLPIGAGLSSSAALELAVLRALASASGAAWSAPRMAVLARQAEHQFAGVSCGVMDQLASALGVADSALLIDCRTLDVHAVPMPADGAVVIMDTGVRRSLAATEYNIRRTACERAVAAVRTLTAEVRALRDVDDLLLSRARGRMDPEAFKRARHVVGEIERPVAMAERLRQGDLEGAGLLMRDSHASLRDLYDVSCPELDAMVAAAERQRSCFGARLTGAGFGGCAVALVAAARAEEFIARVAREYARDTGQSGALFVVRPSDGAGLFMADAPG